jgi:hypothetical protein
MRNQPGVIACKNDEQVNKAAPSLASIDNR